jgi:hypothetical protein
VKKIIVSRSKTAAIPKQNLSSHKPNDSNRYGAWCRVIKRYSVDHTVDVKTAEGMTATRIPVASRKWVTVEDPIIGERNLPPIGSIAYLMMPTGTLDNAFIFGSCFMPAYDKHIEEFLVEGKEDEELTKTEGNWRRTFDKKTGDLEIIGADDDDKTLLIIIKKSEKKIQITDWNENDIIIDENGVKTTDVNGNIITQNKDGIKSEDANGNKITQDSSGIAVEDKNGNKATMGNTGITLEDKNGNKIGMSTAGLGLVTSDSVTWIPNCILMCPFGIVHGGPAAGIVKLKGS